jgi:excisionase family DNA binding protein
MAGATGFEPVAFGFGVGSAGLDNAHRNAPTSSNGTVSAKPGSQRTTLLPRDREDFVTWLLPRERVPSLLTVREVAAQLRACTATVYRLCDEGQLRHIRMLNAIRVDPIDLAAFIDARRSRRQ